MNPAHTMLLSKLATAWEAAPAGTLFGALLEQVEDCAWDSLPQRHCSARLSNMPDWLLERGVDIWMKSGAKPRSTTWPL